MDPPLCIVLPSGLQSLLTSVGLIHTLAADRAVVVATEREHLSTLRRVFANARVTFWFDKGDAASEARAMGLDVMVLPGDPRAMYIAANVPPSCMYSQWHAARDTAKEGELVDSVVNAHGPSFILTWGARVNKKVLPQGIPVVDATRLSMREPLDACGLIEKAMQVHAPDSWFLTLTDLLGASGKKFCHVEPNHLQALACRRKYRRRVTIVLHGQSDGKKCHKI